MHGCNDIKFLENGSWTPVESKMSLSKTHNDDQASLVHSVCGLYSLSCFCQWGTCVSKSKVVQYSIMSVGLAADPGFLAVSLHVALVINRVLQGGSK